MSHTPCCPTCSIGQHNRPPVRRYCYQLRPRGEGNGFGLAGFSVHVSSDGVNFEEVCDEKRMLGGGHHGSGCMADHPQFKPGAVRQQALLLQPACVSSCIPIRLRALRVVPARPGLTKSPCRCLVIARDRDRRSREQIRNKKREHSA